MIEKIQTGIIYTVGLLIVVSILWGCYVLNRQINWSWSYGSMVEQAIEERVAPLEARIEELENAQEKEQD